MPCLLKERTSTSPGIITFTHNEALYGVVAKSAAVRDHLVQAFIQKHWIFGVHIQGDCSHLPDWPKQDWRSFIMWSNPADPFLSSVKRAEITPITCVNFLPQPSTLPIEKTWDICVVSRPSEVKRITETLQLVQRLFALKSDLSVVFVVPDPRDQALGTNAYRIQSIDRNYFELPRRLFTCKQLKQISFISSSQRSFGTFPVSDDLIADLIGRSRFLLLTSHKEGVPRVIAEAFTLGTPCIVSKRLVSGLNKYLDDTNTIFIEDEIDPAAQQIRDAFDHYDAFKIDQSAMQELFCDAHNAPKLQTFLSERISTTGATVDGQWYLEELDFRLACHGRKHNMQFMNDDRLFFSWLAKIDACKAVEPDEDYLFGNDPLIDQKQLSWYEIITFIKVGFVYPILGWLKSARTTLNR
jgi:glycosyltransferase involved in cell wall biosynthesis